LADLVVMAGSGHRANIQTSTETPNQNRFITLPWGPT